MTLANGNESSFGEAAVITGPKFVSVSDKKFMALLKEYPYWLGLLPQVIMLATATLAIFYGFWSFLLPVIFLGAINLAIRIEYNIKRNKPSAHNERGYSEKRIELYRKSRLPQSLSKEEEQDLLGSKYFDGIVYLFHFLHFLTLFTLVIAVAVTQDLWLAIALGIITPVITAGSAETFSHEFVHRKSLFDQMLGGSVWATYCYGTFLSEHPMGHHVKVSTPEDASSAPKGMTIYQFLPQAMIRNPIAGFKLEAKRLANRDKTALDIHNRILWLTLLSLSLAVLSYAVAGVYGLVFFLLQSLFGILVIETANYVMHYGLQRKKMPDGRYERVSPLHSWNREGFECFFSINLTRHSDHHAFPRRPYPILRHFSESPELPVGYDMLAYAAFYPKLWFKIMDPAVDDVMNKLRAWQEQGVDDYKRVMAS